MYENLEKCEISDLVVMQMELKYIHTPIDRKRMEKDSMLEKS